MEKFSKLSESFIAEAELFSMVYPLNLKGKEEHPLKNPLKMLEASSPGSIEAKLAIRETLLRQYRNNIKFKKVSIGEDIRLKYNNKFLEKSIKKYNRKLNKANTWFLECLDAGNSDQECEQTFEKSILNFDEVMRKEFKDRMFQF